MFLNVFLMKCEEAVDGMLRGFDPCFRMSYVWLGDKPVGGIETGYTYFSLIKNLHIREYMSVCCQIIVTT